MLYHFYISYHRIKHIYKLINSEEVEIRNSPLDRLASMAVRTILCAKGLCVNAQLIGTAFGFMFGTDDILKASGREPIFMPYISTMVDKQLPLQSEAMKEQNRIIAYFRVLSKIRAEGKEIDNTINTISADPSLQDLTGSDRGHLIE